VVREFVRVGGQFIRRFLSRQILTHHFFAIWFRARMWVRWIVFVVSVFVPVFYPFRVGSKTTCS
jgi:hypothetical protein